MPSLNYYDGDEWKAVAGLGNNLLSTSGGTIDGDLIVGGSGGVTAVNTPRAWVSMGADAYGDPAKILDSYGVSSVQFNAISTRNQISFTGSFENTNYACVGCVRQITNANAYALCLFTQSGLATTYALYYALLYEGNSTTNDIKPLAISAAFYSTRPMK